MPERPRAEIIKPTRRVSPRVRGFRGYWFPKDSPFFSRPGARIISAIPFFGVAAWFLSNFFQLRGFVNEFASRIDLLIVTVIAIAGCCMVAASLPKARKVIGVLLCSVVLLGAFALDRLTLSKSASPDLSAVIVYPQNIAAMMVNNSEVTVKDAVLSAFLWRVSPSGGEVLQVRPYRDGITLRKHEAAKPYWLIYSQSSGDKVKEGDRVFGWVEVTCPDCLYTRRYWVNAFHGIGGWYAEMPLNQPPPMNFVYRSMGRIDEVLPSLVPINSRRSIEQTVP
jgi:hypothetical protein